MQPSRHLFFTATLIALLSFSSGAQNKKTRYTDYERGYSLMYYGNSDSAFLMFTRYISNPDDTLKKGNAYRYMGEMQWEVGDLYGAQENLINAIRTFDPLNEKHREDIGYAYSMLGNVSLDLKRYDEAIGFYNTAMPIFEGSDYLLEIMNSKATALQKKGSYDSAIVVYDSIYTLKPGDPKLLARVIDNKARTKWLRDPGYLALPEFWAALKIRMENKINKGLNASYAHLSDYYAKLNPDSALWYAGKMLEKAKEIQNPDDILEAIDKLVTLNSASPAKEYWYRQYRMLNDSLQLSRDTARSRFALIRYDVQKSKADNLVLQQHIIRQRIWMYGLAALTLITITGLSIWYSKRRRRIKQEADNAIRDARLKTSQKVHDVVANGLYGVLNELEHRDVIDREPLMSRIEQLYEKSRNISYDDTAPPTPAAYDTLVHDILNSFSNEQTKVIVVGNQKGFWTGVTPFRKRELQLVLNEIMVNMKKHSHATNVVVIFRLENNTGIIQYKDDGLGLRPGFKFGNGLNNTVSRIKSIGGDITFGKSEKEGLSIAIRFPLEPEKS